MSNKKLLIGLILAVGIVIINFFFLEAFGVFAEERLPLLADKNLAFCYRSTIEPKNFFNHGFSAGMVSLNFDDGFASAYENAVPILDQAGLKSTQYIITDYLDAPGYMKKEQILALAKNGHEIGAHTKTHPRLTQIDNNQLADEIFGSGRDLRGDGFLGELSFADPYGDYNSKVSALVQSAGFIGARTTEYGLNDKKTNPFRLRWVAVNASTDWLALKSNIDKAVEQKKWLILVFHRVDEDGNIISARHELVQQIVDYLLEKKIKVVTVNEGLVQLKGK